MDLPFPVKQGEPITASNTNRTIGAVRWAVNKIQSTFPRAIPKGTSYEAPFTVTAKSTNDGNSVYIKIAEGVWHGRGHYPSKGCLPDYGEEGSTEQTPDIKVPFPAIDKYHDTFRICACDWEIAWRVGKWLVFLADLSTDTGLVEEHPKPYLASISSASGSVFASATCIVPIAVVYANPLSGRSTSHTFSVVQLHHSDVYYTAEYPLATQPFQFYRKSWTLNTFVCNGGLIRVRYPIGIAHELDAMQTEESGGYVEHYVGLGGAMTEETSEGDPDTPEGQPDEQTEEPEPSDYAYKEAWYYIEGVEISVTQESTGSLVSLVYTQSGPEKGSASWIVTDLDGIVPSAGGDSPTEEPTEESEGDPDDDQTEEPTEETKNLYAQGSPVVIDYNIDIRPIEFSEWELYEFPKGDNAVTKIDAVMGSDFTVQIPVAVMRKQKGSDVITCQQIACGVLTAEPQMQFNLRCSETLDNNGQTESSQYAGDGSSRLKSGQEGSPVTESSDANATANRVDVAKFKLEQEELDRANTITGEEIDSE